MRIGLKEMLAFSKLLFPSVKDSTLFESCGVADLITTCCKENDLDNPIFFLTGFLRLIKTMTYLWQWVEEIGKLLRLLH